MKTKSSLIVLIVILAGLTTFYSCNCDECPTPTNQVSQYTLDKTIVETNTTNMATGFETVFSEMIPDSTDRAIFSQNLLMQPDFITITPVIFLLKR